MPPVLAPAAVIFQAVDPPSSSSLFSSSLLSCCFLWSFFGADFDYDKEDEEGDLSEEFKLLTFDDDLVVWFDVPGGNTVYVSSTETDPSFDGNPRALLELRVSGNRSLLDISPIKIGIVRREFSDWRTDPAWINYWKARRSISSTGSRPKVCQPLWNEVTGHDIPISVASSEHAVDVASFIEAPSSSIERLGCAPSTFRFMLWFWWDMALSF